MMKLNQFKSTFKWDDMWQKIMKFNLKNMMKITILLS